MNETTLYLVGVPILLFMEACFLMWLANTVREKTLRLRSAIYVVLISGICLNGIAKFLMSYMGVLWGFLISLLIVFIFIYGFLTEKTFLSGKASFWIAVVYLGVDLILKIIFANFVSFVV